MAKKPDDPNAPKPGDKKKDQTPPEQHEEDVFDTLPPANVENSGISVHEWAALIEEEARPDSGSPLAVDSPSDADLRDLPPEAVVELPQTVPASDSSVKFGAPTPPVPDLHDDGGALAELIADSGVKLTEHPAYRKAPPVDDSAIDLGASVEPPPEEAEPAPGSAHSVVDLGGQADDSSIDRSDDLILGGPRPAAVSDSAIDLAADVGFQQIAGPASDSAIEIDADAIIEESAIDLPGDVIVEESIVTAASPAEADFGSDPDVDLTSEEVIVEGSFEGADLAAPPVVAGAPTDSGIDLTSEEVILGEGIDLGAAPAVPTEGPAAGPVGEGVKPMVAPPVVAKATGDSALDLGASAVIVEESFEGVDVAAPPVDAGQAADSAFGPTSEEEGIDLAALAAPATMPAIDLAALAAPATMPAIGLADLAAPATMPAISLDAAPPPSGAGEEGIDLAGAGESVDLSQEEVLALAGPGDESGIDLADVVSSTGSSSKINPLAPGESGIDLIAEDVILEEPAAAANGGSSRDLIAEGLESGLDLMAKATQEAKSEEDEDALDNFLAQVGAADESSSVDLGSVHTMEVFESPVPALEDSSSINAQGEVVRAGSSRNVAEEIDLEQFAAQPPAEGVHLEEIVVGEEAVEEEIIEPAANEIIVSEEVSAVGEAIDLEQLPAAEGEIEIPADAADVVEGEEEVVSVSSDDVIEGEEEVVVSGADVLEEEEVVASLPAEDDLDEAPAAKPGKKKGAKAEDEEVVTAGKGPPPKAKGRFGAFVLGGMMATVAAAAAVAVVWLLGVTPPKEWRNQTRTAFSMEKLPEDEDRKPVEKVAAQPGGIEKAVELVNGGELDKVNEADLEKAKEDDPRQMLGRANYHWKKYLQKQGGNKPKADDEQVKKALADLDKAIGQNSAEARLRRGQILLRLGDVQGAKADFEAGKKQFEKDAAFREQFEAALEALALPDKATRWLPREMPPEVLVLLLTQFQPPPPPPPPPPPKATPEAGVPFLRALAAVKKGDYSEALAQLKEARERHDKRRFVLPNRPQNPLSDPEEELFLKACDQLKDYWEVLGGLKDPKKYIALKDPKRRNKLLDDFIAASQGPLADKVDKQDKEIAKLTKDVKAVEKDLEDAKDKHKTEIEKADKDLKSVQNELKDAKEALKTAARREDDLKAINKKAMAALNAVADQVGAKFDSLKDADTLVKETTEVAALARNKDPEGSIKKLKAQLAADQSRLKDRWDPRELLPFWLALLQGNRAQPELNAAASKDAQRVRKDAAASEADRGRALVIEGLVQRNEDRYAEAAKTLKEAKDELNAAKARQWLPVVDEALAEVSDPAAAIARRAEELAARNRTAEALAVLKKGLASKALDKKGPLYARSARIALEGAITRGKLEKDDPAIVAARKDAQAAADEGLAEGHYVLGRIYEETGDLKEAVASYRAAVKAHNKLDEQGSRYTAALARALAKSLPRTGGPRPLPPKERISKLLRESKGDEKASAQLLALLLTTALQAKDLPFKDAAEAEKLADEIIKMGNKAPFDALAQALVVKRLYTRALETYLKGLRDAGLLAPQHSNALLNLVRSHPGLRGPSALDEPAADPAAGEKAYASGLNFYAKKRFPEAEREFAAAVEFDNGDARYYYYLGLAKLAQGNRDGYEDFDVGARLERLGRPERSAVSQSLERVQGPLRKALNEVRNRPVKDRTR